MPAVKHPMASLYGPYPFREMRHGDSFLVPLIEGDTVDRLRAQLKNASAYWRRRTGFNFCVAPVEGGVRVWAVIP